ncbi:MAG: DUF1232 domain-containing protein [Deltaproteobacteria bacterium]|nr:MAG: DUF1232 domain-containing protein [Deltaproteobacteria bacterium]
MNKTAKEVVKEIILTIPKLIKLLWRLETDPRVSLRAKLALPAVIAYVISPIDLVPDFIPFAGQVDDVYLIIIVLRWIMREAGEEVVYDCWDGDKKTLDFILTALDSVIAFLPRRVKSLLDGRLVS